MSALKRESAVTISPFLMSRGMAVRQRPERLRFMLPTRRRVRGSRRGRRLQAGGPAPPLVDVNAVGFTIALHGFPVFGDVGARFRELLPGDGVAAGGDFHHFDAMFDGADVEAEPATDAVFFTHLRLWAGEDGVEAAVGGGIVRVGGYAFAGRVDEVDALVRRVVAGDVAEVALDA